ncbi:MAG TPA: hypothetical protein VHO25_20135, partial [Polyangiaceae bacterium]|nr:hypothetical protein [Polyangiaceae bacterium]
MRCIANPQLEPFIEGPDSDDDGLLDRWEQNGIDADCNGVVDIDFQAMRDAIGDQRLADWQHKDLFLELDWMAGEGPMSEADVTALKEAFAQAPSYAGGTPNPDGESGINLWIDTGNGDDLGGGAQIPASSVSRLVGIGAGGRIPYGPIAICCSANPDPAWMCPPRADIDCRFSDLRNQFFTDYCCTPAADPASPNFNPEYGFYCGAGGPAGTNCAQNNNFRDLVFHYGLSAQGAERGPVVEDMGAAGSCLDLSDPRQDGMADFLGAAGLPPDPECINNPTGAEDGALLFSCVDGIDGDGLDASDPDCWPDPLNREPDGLGGFAPVGSCTDGVDNSVLADGIDSTDADDCQLVPLGVVPLGEDGFGPGSCFDSLDNGGDGFADGADATDCPGQPEEGAGGPGSCTNNRDDAPAGAPIVAIPPAPAAALGNGLVDWNDPDCATLPREDQAGPHSCWDSRDNGDGIDQADRSMDCYMGQAGEDGSVDPQTCFDGIDNSADRLIDQFDLDCYDITVVPAVFDRALPEDGKENGTCGDGIDNSGDGADFVDPDDCARLPVEDNGGPGSCFDGIDNGTDGSKDGADTDCPNMPTEGNGGPGSCTNSVDDDGINGTDWDDPSCAALPREDGGIPGSCWNFVDDRSDGIDAFDFACAYWGGWGTAQIGFIEFNHVPTTVMHELGHSLALDHGGPYAVKLLLPFADFFAYLKQPNNAINCKPPYASVMNYADPAGITQGWDPRLSEVGLAPDGTCSDGVDNPLAGKVNGLVDAQEPACRQPYNATLSEAGGIPDGTCGDGVASADGDALADFDDADCRRAFDPRLSQAPNSPSDGTCSSLADTDGDGLGGPDDPQCRNRAMFVDYSPPRFPGGRGPAEPASIDEANLDESFVFDPMDEFNSITFIDLLGMQRFVRM